MSNAQVPEGYKQTEFGVIPEDWKVGELGSLGKFKNGINKGSEDFGHGSPFVNLMDVFGVSNISEIGHLGLVNSNDAEKNVYNLKEGDVLFIRSSVKPSGVGLTTVVKKDLNNTVYSGFLIRFRDQANLETDYKKYCFSEEKFRQSVISNSTVSANTNINQDNLKKLVLAYPGSLDEQHTIAQALSDVDALIASLDKLIAKQRHLKTAAMQQLLTGKMRLPGFGEGKSYKQTEVGIIPEDWEVNPLSYLIEKLEAGVSVNSIEEDNGEYVHDQSVLKTSSVFNGKFFPNECKKILPKDIRRAKLNPQRGTIIISRMNTPALVGECGYVGEDNSNLFLPDRLWITRFKKDSLIDVRWLAYILNYGAFKKAIKDTATGTSGSMKNIAKEVFLRILVPYPKEKEQRAIATVLSDMDTAIAALETRRAKTQAIKQGMMQELLTGRTRLL